MSGILGNAHKKVSMIFEYQKFVKLNEQFIRELELEGGDTTELRNEVAVLKEKILEFKLQKGFRR